MNPEKLTGTKILSDVEAADFVGRTGEIDKLLRHAKGTREGRGLLLLSAPANGASELLRQTYDRLFAEQGEIVPFYFSFRAQNETARQTARRFLQSFLLQTVAFRRDDAKILNSAPGVAELAELAAPADIHWIDRLAKTYADESGQTDEQMFVRGAFSAPLRAAAHGAQVAVLIDDLQYVENQTGETNLLEELKDVYARSTAQFVFAGRRRFVLSAVQKGQTRLQNAEVLSLNPLATGEAELLAEKLAAQNRVAVGEQARDLIVRQFGASPLFISAIFRAARKRQMPLDSFQRVEQLYVEELFGGAVGKYYQTIFDRIAPDAKTQRRILRLLNNALTGAEEKSPAESWRAQLKMRDEEFYPLMRRLHADEIINLSSSVVEVSAANKILRDFISARYRLEIELSSRALVVADALSDALKNAPQMMARHYRRSSAIGLRGLLSAFDCQEVPASFFDYEKFKQNYKGLLETEIAEILAQETESARLPQIVYTAHTVAFYPPISQFSDEERSTVALGFETADYRDENEIVWITAEIDSKLEAPKDLVEFWCDRLEMVALACNFPRYQLWLITPEGFAPEAAEVLKQRGAFGSSRKQVGLLAARLNAENVFRENLKSNEYEMIVPMGEDTEMIAAQTVEEIARRHDFQPRAINQIKTALVEACLNASEHSLSPDRRIYQKFTVEDDKIIITIANRGVKIASPETAESAAQIEPTEGRRGWGLKLMRTLMDEVKFEQVDDGTRISMVKYLR